VRSSPSGAKGAALVASCSSYPVQVATGCQLLIVYKVALLMFMVHENRCPVYLSESVQPVSSNPVRQRLRSASSLDFIVPRTKTNFGDRAFLLPVRQYRTVCPSLSDQLRLFLVFSTSLKPICSTFRFNCRLLSFTNIVMPSRSIFVVSWALN